MRLLAKKKGGRCISKSYSHNKEELEWECSNGHRFFMRPNSVQQGGWCGECSRGLRERIVRRYFEAIFSAPFPSQRPFWLINAKGRKMELDGFNDELKIAFEHHGVQHYEEVPFFHQGKKTLNQQKRRDTTKREICRQHGVKFIEVPYSVNLEDLQLFIIKECRSNGIKVPKNTEKKKIDLVDAYSSDYFDTVKDIAKSKGGVCLSKEYRGSSVPLEFKCAQNHRFKKAPANLKIGQWCKRCAGLERKTIKEMRTFARSVGGKCLSESYTNSISPLEWRCKSGHQFSKSWSKIKSRGFCGRCADAERIRRVRQNSIKKTGSVASIPHLKAEWHDTKNGDLRPEDFPKGSQEIIVWKCIKDKTHIWPAKIYNRTGKKSGCPHCAKTKKPSTNA